MQTSQAVWVLLFAAVLLMTGAVHADVAPADTCTMPGQPCHNAGRTGFIVNPSGCGKPGICSAAKCTRTRRITGGVGGDDDSDGGAQFRTISYDCHRCIATGSAGTTKPTGGSGGSCEAESGTGGSGTGGGDAGGASSTEHGGCSALASDLDASLAGLIVTCGLLLLRRRKFR